MHPALKGYGQEDISILCEPHDWEWKKGPFTKKIQGAVLSRNGSGALLPNRKQQMSTSRIYLIVETIFLMIIALYFIERWSIPCLRCSTDKFVLYSLVKISNVVFCTAQEARTPSPRKCSFHTSLKRGSQKGPWKASLGSLIPLPCSWVTEPGVSCRPKMSHQIL